MYLYYGLAVILHIVVDYLLLNCTSKLSDINANHLRLWLAAIVNGAFVCLRLVFVLKSMTMGILCTIIVSVFAFGAAKRCCMLYFLLSMGLQGVILGLEKADYISITLFGIGFIFLLFAGFGGNLFYKRYVPVEIVFKGQCVRMTALRDTGNTLKDPLTGTSVLIVGADIAEILIGLTKKQLKDPYETMLAARMQGLRILPYTTIGNRGALLAKRFCDVKIGNWRGSVVVAFAPEGLEKKNGYQALTGGMY